MLLFSITPLMQISQQMLNVEQNVEQNFTLPDKLEPKLFRLGLWGSPGQGL